MRFSKIAVNAVVAAYMSISMMAPSSALPILSGPGEAMKDGGGFVTEVNVQRPNRGGGGGHRPAGNRGGGQRPQGNRGGGQRPANRPSQGQNRPANRPNVNRPGNGHNRPVNRPGNGQNRPVNRPGTGANRPSNRPGNVNNRPNNRPQNRTVNRNTNVHIHRGGWSGRHYRWAPGGAIAAGAAIGFVAFGTAVAWAPPPPYPGLCWYYTDSSQRNGFWDTCPW